MKKNLLLIHGGGPTAVINASLYGAIQQAKEEQGVDRILAAIGGTGGLLQKHVKDLTDLPQAQVDLLLQTPGSAIGTSRDAIEPAGYLAMADILRHMDVAYVLMNGGNGTMDACGHLAQACEPLGIRVIGIPKTMDNDLAVTDHSPGFGSAARYIAQSVAEVVADVQGLPIHVVVIEASGRNAGWITAASALARQAGVDGPDLIYLPERPFDQNQFLMDVQRLIDEKKGVVVVCSEGLTDAEGKSIVPPIYQTNRGIYFGDVSAHLAQLVIKELGYKARSEKPGLLGRASMAHVSRVDQAEAILCGQEAVKAVVGGESGKMVALMRKEGQTYAVSTQLVDLKEVMLYEKKLPDDFINDAGNGVTDAFIDWCTPLIGEPLTPMISLRR